MRARNTASAGRFTRAGARGGPDGKGIYARVRARVGRPDEEGAKDRKDAAVLTSCLPLARVSAVPGSSGLEYISLPV